MFHNDPVTNIGLEAHFKTLEVEEGEQVAGICRLIHATSGLLSESRVCADKDHVVHMARTIVQSHRREGAEAQGQGPMDEDMYRHLVDTESERVANLCLEIYHRCALSNDVDWNLLVDNARWIISPYIGEESVAQANIVIGFPGVSLQEDNVRGFTGEARDTEFPAQLKQPLDMGKIADFLNQIGLREQFIVNFTEDFQAREWRGDEYIVWVEYIPSRGNILEFFYDDGDELDEYYRNIICRLEDIASTRKI